MKITPYVMTVEGCDNGKACAVAQHLQVPVVDFTTGNMDDLLFIAKHRLLPVPTVLLMDRTKIVARYVEHDIPTPAEIDATINILKLIN